MRVLEISRDYCKRFYNGKTDQMIELQDGVLFDQERIRHAFNFGNGTEKDLMRYIRDNKRFAMFYDMDKQCFI